MAKVLYIVGLGRSGSTILGNVLGQLDGFTHVGELVWIGKHGFGRNATCGCGAAFRECPVWSAVATRQAEDGDVDLVEPGFDVRYLPLYLTLPAGRRRAAVRLEVFLRQRERLYRAIADVAYANVIVDSSKYPWYACALALLPTVELHLVHLVRDARAVAYSWQRRKRRRDDGAEMRRVPPWSSATMWSRSALLTALLRRSTCLGYQRIRYEDFVSDPKRTVRGIVRRLDRADPDLSFLGDGTVELRPCHTVWGNPDRVVAGPVPLREDTAWRTGLPRTQRLVVSLLTWPWLLGYGYLARSRRAADR